jgi:hypothetical protein
MLRFLLIALGIAGVALCAMVFEAASATGKARELLTASAATVELPQRRAILTEAVARVNESWAQPTLWHAGAAEAASAVYAAQAGVENGDQVFLQRSVTAAARAVSLSPVQPRAWTRLAAFAQIGLPNVPCSVEQCLNMSWRAGPQTDTQTSCTRLRIAQAQGLLTGPDDERILWYLHSGVTPLEAARCLDFISSADLFSRLIEVR